MMQRTALFLALLAGAFVPQTVNAQSATATGPETVVFEAKRGAVTFTHAKHAGLSECVACHHESKAEKPLESEYQKCSACHTNPATAPVKTSLRNSMHDTVGKTGICYDCHAKEAAAGKAMPSKCADCHKDG